MEGTTAVKTGENVVTETFCYNFKEELEKRKKNLECSLKQKESALLAEESDIRQIKSEKEWVEEQLADTIAALTRIRSGKFGICLTCGGDIDSPRLIVLPTAKDCMSCQRKKRK